MNIRPALTALFVMLTLVSFAQPTSAGTKDGGGGKGVSCGSNLRVLDLYEAEEVDHLPMGGSLGDLTANLMHYGAVTYRHFSETELDVTNPNVQKEAYEELDKLRQKFQFIPKGTRLPVSKDATVKPLPRGCKLVQIAFLKDEHTVLIDPEYWDRLNALDQSALILHEYLYMSYKFEGGARTSDATRKAVGLIYSADDKSAVLAAMWNAKSSIFCGAGGVNYAGIFQVYLIDAEENGIKGIRLLFFQVNDAVMIAPTTVFIPTLSLQKVMSGVNFSSDIVVPQTKQKTHFEFTTTSSYQGTSLSIRAWAKGSRRPTGSPGFCGPPW